MYEVVGSTCSHAYQDYYFNFILHDYFYWTFRDKKLILFPIALVLKLKKVQMNFHWMPPPNDLRKADCQKEKHIRSEIMTIFNVFHFIFGIFLIKRQEWKKGEHIFHFSSLQFICSCVGLGGHQSLLVTLKNQKTKLCTFTKYNREFELSFTLQWWIS